MTGEVRRPWAGSTRRARLPADWPARRRAVLTRDGFRCRIRDDCCVVVASEVDHIEAGDNHELGNLQAACPPCHARKSSREGAAARPRRNRPPEVHPALK